MPPLWIVLNLAFMASVLASPGVEDDIDLAIEWTCLTAEGGTVTP